MLISIMHGNKLGRILCLPVIPSGKPDISDQTGVFMIASLTAAVYGRMLFLLASPAPQ